MPTLTVKIPGGRLGNFLAGAAVASVIGGTAAAITSADFTYSAVKVGRYSIGPSAMLPRDTAVADNYNINSGDVTGVGCFLSAVHLPEGAIAVNVTTWYKSDASSDIEVFAYRHNLLTGTTEALIDTSVLDNSATRKFINHGVPVAFRTINNTTFDYSYDVCLGAGTTFYGARINYTYTSAGD